MPFSVIPVLDVKDDLAVHAIGGFRDRYRPLRTILLEGSCPIDIARAYRDRLRLGSLYLADLDAIAGKPPKVELYRSIVDEGIDLWLDAGLRDIRQARELIDIPGFTLIVGLETIGGPDQAKAILDRVGPSRVIFSLDQSHRIPLTAKPNLWKVDTSAQIAARVAKLGFERIILLDLARVGTGRGTGPHELIGLLRQSSPAPAIFVGGGISGMADIVALRDEGASGVLVGSALHDGRIGIRELSSL